MKIQKHRKLNDEEVALIRRLLKEGMGACDIARRHGFSEGVCYYYHRHRQPNRVNYDAIKAPFDSCNRATWEGFQKYWTVRPWYFRDVYGCDPTPENLEREYKAVIALKKAVKEGTYDDQVNEIEADDYAIFGTRRASRHEDNSVW